MIKRKYWTVEQEKIVIEHYADSTPEQMRDLLGQQFSNARICDKAKKLGVSKSKSYLDQRGQNAGGRFMKGCPCPTKGKPHPTKGNAFQTLFKKGQVPKNHKPVGSIRTNVEGYLEIKTEEGLYKWRLLHREVWKTQHGSYPPKGTAIVFKDGNRKNCNPDNLELITRQELLSRNSFRNFPQELQEVIHMKATITRIINERSK